MQSITPPFNRGVTFRRSPVVPPESVTLGLKGIDLRIDVYMKHRVAS
jgi:hypothetical protein